MNTIKEQIAEILIDATSDDLMLVNNQFCENNNYNDDLIYYNNQEFFEMFYSGDNGAFKAVQNSYYGNYNYSHDFVRFDGYGNLESLEHIETDDLVDSLENIINDIIENYESYSNIDILADLEIEY